MIIFIAVLPAMFHFPYGKPPVVSLGEDNLLELGISNPLSIWDRRNFSPLTLKLIITRINLAPPSLSAKKICEEYWNTKKKSHDM